MDQVSGDQAKQSFMFVNNFLEKLRTQTEFNLLSAFTYQDIASMHISMLRLESFIRAHDAPAPQRPVATPTPAPVQKETSEEEFTIHTI
jgi:hypothetical protein